jgi:hypothetical protein
MTLKGNADFLKKDILNLLVDEQGLSMGRLLAVKYDTPTALVTHWFRL